jgi:hypothetical protein
MCGAITAARSGDGTGQVCRCCCVNREVRIIKVHWLVRKFLIDRLLPVLGVDPESISPSISTLTDCVPREYWCNEDEDGVRAIGAVEPVQD